MSFQAPKGTHDIYGDEARAYDWIESVLKATAYSYGFSEMRTPIFEATDLFTRSVGSSSDVVRKEMYTFLDKGERSMTLRPELTAGIMRAIAANKLYATQQDFPLKAWYLGPAFRYERPQAGRSRQFSQFGIESVGVQSFLDDVEVILFGYSCLRLLGLENIEIRINTLGDQASRDRYREALKAYFSDKIAGMCEDCQQRFVLNPLRILDCKVEADHPIIDGAPKLRDYLSEEAAHDFDEIIKMLESYEIPVVIDDNLVRGLDYYSHIVFEFHYTSASGKKLGAIGAGGHYSKLLEEVGGPHLEGIGLAFGMSRIYDLLKDENLLADMSDHVDISIMALSDQALLFGFDLAQHLRLCGYRVDMLNVAKSIKAQFKRAERKNASLAVILGEDEITSRQAILRDFAQKTQVSVSFDQLTSAIDKFFAAQATHEHDHEHHCHCLEEGHEGCCHDHDDDHECSCHDHEDDHECCCHDHEDDHEEGCCGHGKKECHHGENS